MVCQLIFMATIDASPVAVMSFVITVLDLLWRVIKRTLRVMAAEVEASEAEVSGSRTVSA